MEKRLLLVDDHEVVRKGTKLLIETVFDIEVEEAATAEEALQRVADGRFDLVLVDARMPGHDGIWVIRQLALTSPQIPVIVLSTYDTEDYVDDALDAGASGYLLKDSTTDQLREAIDTALTGGGIYLHPQVAQRAYARSRRPETKSDSLSPRELEVLQLIAQGATNHEIGVLLFVSEKTVKAHLSSIYRKLSVSNRTQAASRALRERMVSFA